MTRKHVSTSVAAALFAAAGLFAQTSVFEKKFEAIRTRSEYRHSRFGVEFYSIGDERVVYSWNAQELFVPGSTTKLLSVGTALRLLGPDFRFHTKVYRTGVIKNETLQGDLVLVASGDPNLSNRIQADGSMAFQNEDHSYDGYAEAMPVTGDPLAVLHELATKVAAAGIRRVSGKVKVDISLFPEGRRELGTGVVLSPIVVNDNLVDVIIKPGASEGEAAVFEISPKTRYVTITNRVKTTAPNGKIELTWGGDVKNPDGTHSVTLSGEFPAGAHPKLQVYKVPAPSRFAEVTFEETLRSAGIHVDGKESLSMRPLSKSVYATVNEVAEHISPRLQEEAKITLKVSQNLHASMMPYLCRSVPAKGTPPTPCRRGFNQEHALLQQADLDLTGAVQNDGAGGAALFAPDFMVHFLLYMQKQPFFGVFKAALPILGKDGTLFDIQVDSDAAGHVFAKTGTSVGGNALEPAGGVIEGKDLAGFIDAKDGKRPRFLRRT